MRVSSMGLLMLCIASLLSCHERVDIAEEAGRNANVHDSAQFKAAELLQARRLLDDELVGQQRLLHAAQNDHEREQIRETIASLHEERRTLETLLDGAIDVNLRDAKDWAEEQRVSNEALRYENRSDRVVDR